MSDIMIKATRDSVATGDDIYSPHETDFRVPRPSTIDEVIHYVLGQNYLAHVSGKNHSWSVMIGGEIVATILGNQKQPEPSESLSRPAANYLDGGALNMHFKYHSAQG